MAERMRCPCLRDLVLVEDGLKSRHVELVGRELLFGSRIQRLAMRTLFTGDRLKTTRWEPMACEACTTCVPRQGLRADATLTRW